MCAEAEPGYSAPELSLLGQLFWQYLVKGRKIRVYNASIIIFNKSIIKSTIAGLNLDLNPDDLILIRESNG